MPSVKDAAIPKSSEVGRITVVGYGSELPQDYVERALRELYSSCGEITDVYVPFANPNEITLRPCSYIYFVGKEAVDKALKLNGTDVGGWKVSAKDFTLPPSVKDTVTVRVKGYDTMLSEVEISSALRGVFSSCGRVKNVIVNERTRSVLVDIYGDNAEEKASELSGIVVGGRKLVVTRFSEPSITTVHRRPRYYYGAGHRGLATSAEYKSRLSSLVFFMLVIQCNLSFYLCLDVLSKLFKLNSKLIIDLP